MKQVIQIRCKNNKKSQKVEIGSTLFDIFSAFDLKMTHGPVSARVNNKVEGMHYRVYNSKDVEFLDMTSSSGSRAYTRTLFFVLCKAREGGCREKFQSHFHSVCSRLTVVYA